jgi:WD40 repeat protein
LLATSNNIKLFDSKGNLLKSIQHRKEDVLLLSATWHPSGNFFACGDYGDGSIKTFLQFWDENGALLQSIDISKGEYRNLVWNKKGTILASASDKLRIWNNRGKLLFEGNSSSYLWGLSWNEKEEKIITSSLSGEVLIWNAKGEILKRIE